MSSKLDECAAWTESGTGEELALLQEMIVERDRRIHQLILLNEACDRKIIETKASLHQARTDSAAAQLAGIHLEEDFEKQKQGLAKRISQLESSIIQQNGGLHVYANILKEAAPESADSSYVIRMQSQLCKAMHSMGALERQLEIVTKFCSNTLSTIKGSISGLLEEKTMVELKLMNQLMEVDTIKRRMEEGLRRSKVEVHESLRDFSLSQSFASNGTEKENENEDEDEEEIDQDLLVELLEERRQDIAFLELENSKQVQQIEDLKAKISAITTFSNA